MAENSKIEWTDATFNPWIGCTKVGPGCDHCYAAAQDGFRKWTPEGWGPGNPRKRTSAANWRKPLQWNEEAGRGRFVQCDGCGRREFRKWDNSLPPGGLACCSNPDCNALPESESTPVRPRIFCASLADVFDNEVDPAWRADLLMLIRATPNLGWLLLTKRVGNVMPLLREAEDLQRAQDRLDGWEWLHDWTCGDAPRNVWLGATIVNQAEADRDIPKLLQVPARVRWLSMEPLLGSVNLTSWIGGHTGLTGYRVDPEPRWIDWIVVGGESGPGARPMNPQWARDIRDQCQAAEVPFLFKQNGEWVSVSEVAGPGEIYEFPDGRSVRRVGKKRAGRTLDWRTWDGYPEPER